MFTATGVLPAAAETEIANPNDAVNQHFAVASELFGEDEVQFHNRIKGPEGTLNKVYAINCTRQMFKEIFTGETDPVDFPLQYGDQEAFPIEKDAVVAPLASYVCKQHGVPMAGFEW